MRFVILAGDIGGTKSRLASYAPDASPRTPVREERYRSRDYPSLEAMVTVFLAGGPQPTAAAFGIAGPVVDGRVAATNLPWTADARALATALGGARVTLLNDLAANAHGLAALSDGDLRILQRGTPRAGPRALIAAGTGLGEAILPARAGGWDVLASEGGHCDFAPRTPFEDALNLWLRARHGHVSVERVLSGPGLVELYAFLGEMGAGEEPEGFAAACAAADDAAPLIGEAALAGGHSRARLAVERFMGIYGAEAGNLALKALAVGGVFVGGGMAPRLLPLLADGGFVRAFADKGRMRGVLESIAIAVVLDDRCALWGAAAVAMGPRAGIVA